MDENYSRNCHDYMPVCPDQIGQTLFQAAMCLVTVNKMRPIEHQALLDNEWGFLTLKSHRKLMMLLVVHLLLG